MAVATGKQVLLLNNDVVVTTGWLGRMLRALRSDEKVGLVGPWSNLVSGPQQIEVGYDEIAELDGFAWDWGKAHGGVVIDVNRLVGFCLLIEREVIDAIGLLDEQFGIGCFEDDDYCLRAIAAGYRAVIAGDAFVHHYGSRTFLGSGVDAGALMRENQQRFRRKVVGQRRRPGTLTAAFGRPLRGGARWARGARPARGRAVRGRYRAGGRPAAAAGPCAAEALALHDRARQCQDAAGLPREHPAVGRRDDRRRHRLGRRNAADRRVVRRQALSLPVVRRFLGRPQ